VSTNTTSEGIETVLKCPWCGTAKAVYIAGHAQYWCKRCDKLMDELAQGHEAIPFSECDNWDWKTGCKGHECEMEDS
jgi:hypothetical protein